MVAGSAATCCVACCPPRRRPPDWRRPPTRSPASTYGCRHSVRWSAFSWLRSISYSTPSRPNRKVPTAGEPSRSSVSSTTSRRAIRLQSVGTHASMHVATRQSPAAFDLGPKITSRWSPSAQPSSASSNSTSSTTTFTKNTARKEGFGGHARDLKHARYALWKNPEDLTEKQAGKLGWAAKVKHRLYRAY